MPGFSKPALLFNPGPNTFSISRRKIAFSRN
jgi:hypothetical protein